MKENIYYRKEGRKYVPVAYFEPEGLPEGLWLIYRNDEKDISPNCMMNMLSYTREHKLQEVGSFCDFYTKHREKIIKAVSKEVDEWVQKKKGYSLNDISIIVCKVLSEIKDESNR